MINWNLEFPAVKAGDEIVFVANPAAPLYGERAIVEYISFERIRNGRFARAFRARFEDVPSVVYDDGKFRTLLPRWHFVTKAQFEALK